MRVLAIDGGGIRGLLPAVVLAELERLSGHPVHRMFDLIAGSSAGGLVASALTVPGNDEGARWSANDLTGLFEREGGRIFRRTLGRSLRTRFGFSGPRYADHMLNHVLHDYLGATRLRETTTGLMICAYDVERRIPVRFTSWQAREDPGYDRALWQVVRSTIAAPTYFAPLRLTPPGRHRPGSMIDGGIVAHNPALLATIEGATLRPQEEITVVSLGTGELSKRVRWEDAQAWGQIDWARPIIDMFFDASSSIVQEQLHRMLGPRNHRFQISLSGCTEMMDDASPRNLAALRRNAELLIEQRHDELAQLAHDLSPEQHEAHPGDRRSGDRRRIR